MSYRAGALKEISKENKMGKKINLSDLDTVWTEAQDLTEELVESKGDEDKTIHAVADFLDAILPLDALIPGPLGKLAEEADGLLFEEIVAGLSELFKIDPEKQAARRERRKERQADRKERRKERRAKREERREEG